MTLQNTLRSTVTGGTAALLILAGPALSPAPAADITDYIEPVVMDEFNTAVTDAEREEPQPKSGGILRVRVPSSFDKMNPLLSTSAADAEIQAYLFDTLLGLDDEKQETFPLLAQTFSTADLIRLPEGEIRTGMFLDYGDESDPASTVTFVPDARVHVFTKGDVSSADPETGTLTLLPDLGGDTITGQVTEGYNVWTVNTAYDPALRENAETHTIGELDTWEDRIAGEGAERPFAKRQSDFLFTVREGVTWHDGEPFTAEDMLFTFETMMNVDVDAQRMRAYFEDIDVAEITEDGDLHFRTRRPFHQLLRFLGGLQPIPEHVFQPEKFGGDDKAFAESFNSHPFLQNPVGTGAFRFRDWERGTRLVIERNPDYWANNLPQGRVPLWTVGQPWLESVRYEIIPEKGTALKEMEKGTIDADRDVEPDIYASPQTNTPQFVEQYVRAAPVGFLYTYIGINNARPLFSEPETRRALAMLIPDEKIASDVLYDLAFPITGPAYAKGPGYERGVPEVEFDPRAAKRMLRRAGWLDRDGDGIIEKEIGGELVPFRVEYMIHSGRDYHQKVADIIKEQVEQAGIEFTIRKLDFNVLSERIRDKDFDLVRMAWSAPLEPDFRQIWHSSQIKNRGDNFISYSNPQVDELIDRMREEFDAEKRWEMAREIHRLIAADQPVVFRNGFYTPVFYNRGLRGVKFYPNHVLPVRYTEWWWDNPAEHAQ